MNLPAAAAVFAAAVMSVLAPGCCSPPAGAEHVMPAKETAYAELVRLAKNPARPPRPIVILNGFRSPALFANSLRSDIAAATSDDDVLLIAYPLSGDIDGAAREAVRLISERWPGAKPDETAPVDVVGISMGGLVARWAALAPGVRRDLGRGLSMEHDTGDFPRLHVARLFTFATPHQGANLAGIGMSRAARDMKPDSPFLKALNAAKRDYELVCYTYTGDSMVGARHAAPPGMIPIWNDGPALMTHFATHLDPVFIADLIRRLRGEPALVEPTTPPPSD